MQSNIQSCIGAHTLSIWCRSAWSYHCPSYKCKMHACLWSRVNSKEVDDKPIFFSDLLMINLLAVDDKPTCRGEINDQMKHRLRCECMGNYALDAWTDIKFKMISDHGHEMLSVCARLGIIVLSFWLCYVSAFLILFIKKNEVQ